jgi:threonylcarbamoyladenosine tRNA methylthiotransferase MtaB
MTDTNRFVIKTLGCKVNRSESDNLAAVLRQKGLFELQTDPGRASSPPASDHVCVCVINTCTVTEKASMQSRQAIRQAIRAYPRARIIVTGCYAQTEPGDILKIEGVSRVVPQQEKQSLLEAVFQSSDTPLPPPPFPWSDVNAFSPEETRGDRTRAVLKVQDGCNSHCTYCIVPRARGKNRSMPEARVISNLHGLERAGYQEVVLSGIHLGNYGLDFSPPSSLMALLEKIEGLNIMKRVRLSSIEPGELSNDIIDFVAQSNTFCRHFHIPLQSGDNDVLRKMGRFYSRSFFRDLVQTVHARIPDAAIGVDVLVGFPGESDAAFENTFELIDSLPVSYLHVFPFSPRKSTPAYSMPEKVKDPLIKARAARMRALGEMKRQRFYDTLSGRTVEVLVEGAVDAAIGLYRGRTSNYVPVNISGYTGGKNQFVTVKVENVGEKGVMAHPI